MFRAVARRRQHARRATGDAGVSLTELLVTIMIMGIAFTAILSALAVTIRSSRTHAVSADSNMALTAGVEAVKAAEYCDPALSCDPMATYQAEVDGVDLPDGWEVGSLAVVDISPVATDLRTVQRITVDVTSPDGDVTRSLTIAKTAPLPAAETPPPGADECTEASVTSAAYTFVVAFLVEVDTPVGSDACTAPILVRLVGSTGSASTLTQNQTQPWRWSGWLEVPFSRWFECLFNTCQVQILQQNGTVIETIAVEAPF
jgi:prepilin-type N-terminal cleavage/methylation domain-containing protein